ncbi:MAG TPA: molecular chaperone DnaJ [Thermoplasmata archaeon]|nr:molecular chaperone DnaJ [Thermoplasmata archaeon]
MAKRDYYDVLGVPRGASKDIIKQAYRRLAKQHHPDLNKEDPRAAEEKFKELSEAYEVLIDEEKRALYNQYGHAGIEQRVWGGSGFDWSRFTHQGDVEDIFGSDLFRQFFGGSIFDGVFGGRHAAGPRPGQDLYADMEVTLQDVLQGTRRQLRVPHSESCRACKGTGAKGAELTTCPRCKGAGQIRNVQARGYAQFVSITTCGQCRGRGALAETLCPECKGEGRIDRVSLLSVEVPEGAFDGLRLRLGGKGQPGGRGGRPGDLYITLHFRADDRFTREGSDLYTDVPLDVYTAILGGEVKMDTLDSTATVKVPAGTQTHTLFRIRGKGLPDVRTHERGDLYARVVLVTPRNLTAEERRTLERLAASPNSERKGFFDRLK